MNKNNKIFCLYCITGIDRYFTIPEYLIDDKENENCKIRSTCDEEMNNLNCIADSQRKKWFNKRIHGINECENLQAHTDAETNSNGSQEGDDSEDLSRSSYSGKRNIIFVIKINL